MKFYQQWFGLRTDQPDTPFPVHVPGSIQYDYGKSHGFGDVHYGSNCEQYRTIEDCTWIYQTNLQFTQNPGERVFFVSHGIDYESDILLNGQILHHQEGMFTKIELDITDHLPAGNLLQIIIHPHPKRPGATEPRFEADHCCKPPVGYGWDWHPRLLTSGIWEDTYIETRDSGYIANCEPFYILDEGLQSADVYFEIQADAPVQIELTDQDGHVVYAGTEQRFHLKHVHLWWCNEQGEPYLYHWRVFTASHEVTGTIGFRTVRLVLNEGCESEGSTFPKSRRFPPMTIELNGRRIFAKGSNWVNPDIFNGMVTEETYRPLVQYAKDAHMNILRAWGGAAVDKNAFFDLCDQLGILVWQEFPLACNDYPDDDHYLAVLEQEATSIITRLRRHPCIALWSGGNELFNSWSGMDDQSHPLRLLNKLCYELDRKTPFVMTSPLMGAGHGGYLFFMPPQDKDVFTIMTESRCTAYPEFGIPSISEPDYLRQIMPEEELFPVRPTENWILHHGFGAWAPELLPDAWAGISQSEHFFGQQTCIDDIVSYQRLMQAEGYKAMFEEARRQKPFCSMALNWCYNHPWKVAAGGSLLLYPHRPTKAYYAATDALRPILASARISKFAWAEGETFHAQLWLLNDAPTPVEDTISAYLELDGQEQFLLDWHTGVVPENTNQLGPELNAVLPAGAANTFRLILRSQHGYGSSYTLCYRKREPIPEKKGLNM